MASKLDKHGDRLMSNHLSHSTANLDNIYADASGHVP